MWWLLSVLRALAWSFLMLSLFTLWIVMANVGSFEWDIWFWMTFVPAAVMALAVDHPRPHLARHASTSPPRMDPWLRPEDRAWIDAHMRLCDS